MGVGGGFVVVSMATLTNKIGIAFSPECVGKA